MCMQSTSAKVCNVSAQRKVHNVSAQRKCNTVTFPCVTRRGSLGEYTVGGCTERQT